MNNFLITSHGRTGTKFLSDLMNKSLKWTVLHEPRNALDDINFNNIKDYNDLTKLTIPSNIIDVFKKNNYGEVNSVMKYYFTNIDIPKKAIIYRDYKEVITSFSNRRNTTEEIFNKINEVNFFHNYFYKHIKETDTLLIEFDKMTNSVDYLHRLLLYFDIDDVKVNNEILNRKVNYNKIVKYKNYNDLPPMIKNKIESLYWEDYSKIKHEI